MVFTKRKREAAEMEAEREREGEMEREREPAEMEAERENEGEVPWLFLSHTGAQKDFARRLHRELFRVGHIAFFDEDPKHSLPKGHYFPPRILQACRGCKMAIVVLSEEYVQKKWPMMELEQFTFHNPSALIYPLFYKIKPEDLSNTENLKRWKSTWDIIASRASTSSHPNESLLHFNSKICSWPEALSKLDHRNGEVMIPGTAEHAYLERIISHICKEVPPPQRYLLGDHFKGGKRMQQKMDDRFQGTGCISNGACKVVGVYGLGGSGKTSLCQNMADFYSKDFPGRSCILELPTKRGEAQLLEAIKKVLPNLGQFEEETLKRISTVQEAMQYLKNGLKMSKVFLAMDNVWDWAFESARAIVSMEFISGSKMMITSRSEELLKRLLLPTYIMPVPSITEDEAIGALMSYSGAISFPHVIPQEQVTTLARSCFFNQQCHPLLLMAKAAKLRVIGGRITSAQDWNTYMLSLQARPIHDDEQIEATVLSVLETSLLQLPSKLQEIFLDLATCVPKEHYPGARHCEPSLLGKCKWLSLLRKGYTKEDIRYHVIELEYHGLLEIIESRSYFALRVEYHQDVNIHDLYKSLASRRVVGPDGVQCRYLFEGHTSVLSEDECRKLKYIHTHSDFNETDILRILRLCSEMQIFMLHSRLPFKRMTLVMSVLQSLRFLTLEHCEDLEDIEGWKWAPNLVSIELYNFRRLKKLGDIGCLHKLEKLVISVPHWSPTHCTVPDLTGCRKLKTLKFSSTCLKSLNSLGLQPSNLQELDLSSNRNLVDMGTIGTFTALQRLSLVRCSSLREIPNASIEGSVCALTALEKLDLEDCRELERIPDLTNLARLGILNAEFCSSLKELKLGAANLSSLKVLNLGGCTSLVHQYNAGAGRCSSLVVHEYLRSLIAAKVVGVPGDLPFPGLIQQLGAENILEDSRKGQHEVGGVPCIQSQSGSQYNWNAFVNLRELHFEGCGSMVVRMDVSGVPSLESLDLEDFESLQLMHVALPKLSCLRLWSFPSLQAIEGALPELKKLEIQHCPSLEQICNLGRDAASTLYNKEAEDSSGSLSNLQLEEGIHGDYINATLPKLEIMHIHHSCESWTTLPDLPASLREFKLWDCSSLRDASSLASLTSLENLDMVRGCDSLEELPDLSHLTSLRWVSCSGLPPLQVREGCRIIRFP